MGRRVASEVLLTDKPLTAQAALSIGYINGILDSKEVLIENGMFFDFNKVDIIQRLLKNDMKTMTNAKRLMNQGRDRQQLIDCFKREGEALYNRWIDPDFLPNIMNFLQSSKKSASNTERPKLWTYLIARREWR